MSFPVKVSSHVVVEGKVYDKSLTLNQGLTLIVGQNGAGKTHILRGLKDNIQQHLASKKVRFLSAGRMGPLEEFRSNINGHYHIPRFEEAQYGSVTDVTRRHSTETLTGDFQTLSARPDILIKVQERLRKLFKRDILIEWNGGFLKVKFARLNVESTSYSSGREASGLLHLVGILAALYDDEVGALLIDEPEVSLHPQLQAFLLKEINSVVGFPSEENNKKIIVIATHSTEMIKLEKPSDLLSIVFCYDLTSDLIQLDSETGELKNTKVRSLITRLGQEHKLSLFCKRPLLVEGPSDVLICTALASKAGLYLEAAGSQLLPVIGKGQMPVVLKLLRLLGKDPVVLVDADAITDDFDLVSSFVNGNYIADSEASLLGQASASQMANLIYRDFCRLVTDRWVDIEDSAKQHPYWINKESGSEELAKRRSSFCTLFNENTPDFPKGSPWYIMRNRLITLMSLLESVGCFVLRRGSIESYYMDVDRFTSSGKPSAAVDEMEFIEQKDLSEIQSSYDDIIRCLKYSADSEKISEAESIRDILLSVAAPALGRLQMGATSQEITILARSIIGERSNLFGFKVEDEKLIIDLESRILNIDGFPIIFEKNDDVIKKVNRSLGLN